MSDAQQCNPRANHRFGSVSQLQIVFSMPAGLDRIDNDAPLGLTMQTARAYDAACQVSIVGLHDALDTLRDGPPSRIRSR